MPYLPHILNTPIENPMHPELHEPVEQFDNTPMHENEHHPVTVIQPHPEVGDDTDAEAEEAAERAATTHEADTKPQVVAPHIGAAVSNTHFAAEATVGQTSEPKAQQAEPSEQQQVSKTIEAEGESEQPRAGSGQEPPLEPPAPPELPTGGAEEPEDNNENNGTKVAAMTPKEEIDSERVTGRNYREKIPETYESSLKDIRRVLKHPYSYGYTHYAKEREADMEGREVGSNYFVLFHGLKFVSPFINDYKTLDKAGLKLAGQDVISPEAVTQGARVIFDKTGELIRKLPQVHEKPLSSEEVERLKGPAVFFAKRVVAELDTGKRPDEVGDYLLLFVPGFTWRGHTCPTGIVPEEYQEQLEQRWAPQSLRAADYLARAADIAERRTPLHKAIEAANAVARDGYPNEAYAIKAQVFTTALTDEKKRANLEPGIAETPFLTYGFAAAITGEVGAVKTGPNYAKMCEDTMNETWDHFAEETTQETPGPATAFVRELTSTVYTTSEVVPYLVRSVMLPRAALNHDIPAIVRGMQQLDPQLGADITKQITALPNRPVLTNDEATRLMVKHVPPEAIADAQNPNVASAALAKVGGAADMYGFRTDIARTKDTAVVVTGDFDPTAQTIDATIEYRTPGSTLRLPITVDLETGTVHTNTVDAQPLDPGVATHYQAAVVTAIMQETAKAQVRVDEAARLAALREGNAMQRQTEPAIPVAQPGDQTQREKTRGIAHPALEATETTAEPVQERSPEGRIILEGVSLENINNLLNDEHIAGLGAARVLDRIRQKAETSNAGADAPPFGKHSRFAQVVKGTDHASVRYLSWVNESGSYRIYFRSKGGGVLELCGIYAKTGGEKEQLAYFKNKLAPRLKKAEQAERNQSEKADRQEGGRQPKSGNSNKGGKKAKRR